jgi:two-component system copper resistance phosphate regulon response regulator CusR
VSANRLSSIGTERAIRAESALCASSGDRSKAGVLQLPHSRPSLPMSQIQILLVEDDNQVANSIIAGLKVEGFRVVRTRTAEEGLSLLPKNSFDVLLLDITLPGKSGLHMLLEMRASRIGTPVLILTARDTVGDRVLGLESGADDYLVKPFAFAELLARIRVLVRRRRPGQTDALRCGDLVIDVDTRGVTRAGIPLKLTRLEFEILQYLCIHQGHVVTREMLARDIWKETNYNALDNIIDVNMVYLRRKVDDISTCKLIHTVRGVGFIFREQDV